MSLINREDLLKKQCSYYDYNGEKIGVVRVSDIVEMPSAEQRWIPFESRPLTDEEKEEHPEWSFIVDCQLPENGQQILVSIDVAGHERVQVDEFYDDDGVYLDSGYAIGVEAVAWMPLPEPYQEESV